MKFIDRLLGRNVEPEPPMRDMPPLMRPLAVPAVHLVPTEVPSTSHLGGVPSLPAGTPWPEKGGKKLQFLAQLSLTELSRVHAFDWLPQHGALLFFYDVEDQPWGFDPKDRGAWAVLHVSDPDGAASPADPAPASSATFSRRNVGFKRIDVYPAGRPSVEALSLTDSEMDAYGDLLDESFEGLPRHQVGGFPYPIQNDDMELTCQLASHGLYCGNPKAYKDPRAAALTAGAADWRLLLQIDSDDELETNWGDGGTVYFWIPEAAARARRFNEVWISLQCY